MTLAEQASAAGRGADALQALAVASEYLNGLEPLLERMAEIERQLDIVRQALPEIEQQGYRVEPAQKAVQTAYDRLRDVVAKLGANGLQAAEEPLQAAETAARRALRVGPEIATLAEENQTRIESLRDLLRAAAEQIVQERQRFEQVRRYNPASWTDIRGNGSEAQAALVQARDLLQSAVAKNSQEQQDFGGAEEDLTTAEKRIQYARTLLSAISDRLQHLQEAERLAGEELAEAQRDIEEGWGFIRARDADIGKEPEELLQQASAALQRAEQEMAKEQPDWLVALQEAQQANQLSDRALSGARSEFQEMEKRRHEVERAKAAAVAEAHKVGNFAQIHQGDIGPENYTRLQALLAAIRQAVALTESAQEAEEEERARLLEQALKQLTAATREAEDVYAALYADFQAVDGLRRETSAAVDTAQHSIANAAAWYNHYSGAVPAESQGPYLLEEARRALRPFDPQADAATLQQIRDAAARANDLAHAAVDAMRSTVQQQPHGRGPRLDTDLGDFVTGAMMGALLGNMFGGHRPHYGGWGSGESVGGWDVGGGGGESFGGWDMGGGGGDAFGGWDIGDIGDIGSAFGDW